jgi:hypothetical protein
MKNLIVFLVVSMACGGSYPESEEPRVSLREATCKVSVLLKALKDNDELVTAVLNGELPIQEAVLRAGGTVEEGAQTVENFFACEPLQALPPSYGNKVI